VKAALASGQSCRAAKVEAATLVIVTPVNDLLTGYLNLLENVSKYEQTSVGGKYDGLRTSS